MNHRAYALPIVLVVAISTTLIISTMINRFATARLAVQRQLDSYQEYHARAGIPELIIAWWREAPTAPREFDELIGDSSDPVLIASTRDSEVRVWVRPGGGALPVRGAAFGSIVLSEAERTLDRLAPNDSRLRREVGPSTVSAAQADPRVLEAIATAITGDSSMSSRWAARASDEARSGDLDTAADLRGSASSAGMNSEQIEQLLRIVTVRPSLWIVEAQVTEESVTGSPPEPTQYRGLVEVPESTLAGNDRSWFVDWQLIEREDEIERMNQPLRSR